MNFVPTLTSCCEEEQVFLDALAALNLEHLLRTKIERSLDIILSSQPQIVDAVSIHEKTDQEFTHI